MLVECEWTAAHAEVLERHIAELELAEASATDGAARDVLALLRGSAIAQRRELGARILVLAHW